MGRKFRLSTHRKNEERKKRSPRGAAAAAMKPLRKATQREVTAALVSIPLEMYRMLKAPSLSTLRQRLKITTSLTGCKFIYFGHQPYNYVRACMHV